MSQNLTANQIRENTTQEVNKKNWYSTLWNFFLGPLALFPRARNTSEAQITAAKGATEAMLAEKEAGISARVDENEIRNNTSRKNRGAILYSLLSGLGIGLGELGTEFLPGPAKGLAILGGLGTAVFGAFGAIRKKSEAEVAAAEGGIKLAFAENGQNKNRTQAQQSAIGITADSAEMYSAPAITSMSPNAELIQGAQTANMGAPVQEKTALQASVVSK